jgi:site-specific DNA-cytosine methylase
MQDKLADPGVILEDITTVKAADLGQDISGYLAGFPCQAGSCLCCMLDVTGLLHIIGCHWMHPDQGISRAGNQEGMSDERSNLCTHIWRLWDEAESNQQPLNLDAFTELLFDIE